MVDVVTGVIKENTTILWENDVIKEIGQQLELGIDVDIIDGTGCFVTPGLINGYTHLGLKEVGVRWEGNDSYEASGLIQPHLSVIDGIYPFDKGFELARSSGVTTVHVLPGPENVISGMTAIIKTHGFIIDEMIVEGQHGLSISLGDLPKQAYYSSTKKSLTRMGIASLIREQFRKYLYKDDIEDATRIVMKNVFEKQMPVYVCAHRSDDILTAIRLKEEFKINIVIVHATEAYQVTEALRKSNISIFAGPFYKSKTREELKHLHPSTVVKLNKSNLSYALVTPSVRNLSLEGALAEREGLSNMEALYALTLGAAKILGISHQVGTIEEGKKADLVLWNGDPLELRTSVKETICCGLTVYHQERC